MSRNEDLQPPVQVPVDAISDDALIGLIDEFILREGTDYGREEAGHATKVRQIRTQLEDGKIVIVFDPNEETVTLMTAHEWEKSRRPI